MTLLSISSVSSESFVRVNSERRMKTCYKCILLLVLLLNAAIVGVNIALILLNYFQNLSETSEILLLTPHIVQGQIENAQKLSKVHHPKIPQDSYAGYLTVDAAADSHLFFWYFPAVRNPKNPLILWLNGGPGVSSLNGLFDEIGPLQLKPTGEVTLRKDSWNERYSLLFIDNPVGTGFSRTVNGLITNQFDAGKYLQIALQQFYQLFPNLQTLEFYVAGVSYAGKYIPALAHLIHLSNQKSKQKINLKGLIIGHAFFDPANQLNYPEFLYFHSLIDRQEMSILKQRQSICLDLISKQNYLEAYNVFRDLMLSSDDTPYGSLFSNFTGFQNIYNILSQFYNDSYDTLMQEFLNQHDIKHALHVGGTEFKVFNPNVRQKFRSDILRPSVMYLSELLSHYKVLLYAGNLDIITNPLGIEQAILNMNFSSSDEMKKARKEKWYVGNDLAGYIKTAGNLTYAKVRNVGHTAAKEQPIWIFDIVDRFINNKSFNTKIW